MSLPIESDCAKCGAVPGQPCVGSRGQARRAFHRGRGSRRMEAAQYRPHPLRVDSPIEDKLAGAVAAWIAHHEITDADIETQVPLAPYRLDMVVTVAGRRLVVECDGRTHNSPDAVAHDKRRDRFCVTQGMAVMRFTGAEINHDARDCAAQVGLWIRAQR